MPQSISPDIIRICKLCGQEFHPTARKQFCCNQMKPRKCEACGKEFLTLCSTANTTSTCSKECQVALIKKKRESSAASAVKICKWCGKEFHPTSVRQAYCSDVHYQTCVVCGKKFVIDPQKDSSVKTCSKECRYKLMSSSTDREASVASQKASMLSKYGVENAMQIPGVVDKLKQSNKEKYGTEWYTQTDEYKERVAATDMQKYGVAHHLQSQEVIEKRTATVQERYGVDNVFQSEEVKSKSARTLLDKYGVVNPGQSAEIQEKIVENNLEKYGVAHPMMLAEFQEKAARTNEKLYGRRAYTQQHISNITAWYEFMNDPRAYISAHYDESPTSHQLADDLGVDYTTIDDYLKKFDAKDCIRRAKSLMEEAIVRFIQSLNSDIRIICNDKTAINPMELDVYLPDYNFAIECNPTCTHNSSAADPWGGEPKSPDYHMKKTDMCEAARIHLLHIFGYDWTFHQEVIKSMIRNKVNASVAVIYARKCEVREVSGKDSAIFLAANHRQGSANSPIRLGLYHDNELVSLMTFGKMRGSIGTDSTDLSNCYELVRFCSKLNTSVVGGASKLFNHFVNKYAPQRIRSFSDRAHMLGRLYPVLGFSEVRRSTPGYMWVDTTTDRAYHRVNAQKKNLKKFLKDDSIDLSKTEVQIMIEHGFVQVFDSGTITWEWKA